MPKVVHLCVTRERIVRPGEAIRVRWIEEGDVEAFLEPLHNDQGPGFSLSEWRRLKKEGHIYCGVIEGGRLCASAGLWKRNPDVWEVVAVNTGREFRRRGMGKAVVCFVADYILNNVRVASYTTGEENTASIRTAESVGFGFCTNVVGCDKWCELSDRQSDPSGPCPLLPR